MRHNMRFIQTGVFALAMLLLSQVASAEGEFYWAPFMQPGHTSPDRTLPNQDGQAVTLSEASGDKGYLVVLSRSVD